MLFHATRRLVFAAGIAAVLMAPAGNSYAAGACQQITALAKQAAGAAAQCDRAVRQRATLKNICAPCKPGSDISQKLARLVKQNPSCFKRNYSQALTKVTGVSQYVRTALKGCGYS
jgi:hypothetical protein